MQNEERDPREGIPPARTDAVLASPKLSRPRIGRSRLYRPRLTDMMDTGVRRLVTLVSAGPGWGKTTMVSAWAAARRPPVAWLTLDPYDNDPRVFSAHVLAAVRSTTVTEAGRSSCDVEALPGKGIGQIRALGRLLSQRRVPAVLVLDDFDVIRDRGLIRDLGGLLRPPRDDFQLVLISRSEPAIPLHRLRAAGELTEIRASDLAFTAAEAAELLAAQGVHLPPGEVELLVQRTEGWAVGLQLAAAFVAGPAGGSVADFTGDLRPVDDYLSEEVLDRQTPEFRTFLLYTSICEHLCADLADAITLGHAGQRTLEELEQVNQFVVRLDSRPSWFRYHHLMRDVLQHRLTVQAPEMLPQLHRRAAAWYADQDLVIEALQHAVAARDWAYAGRLVVDAAPMILSRDRGRLVKVLEQMPAAAFADTAELVLCGVILVFNAGDYAAIGERLDEAEQLLTDRPLAERRGVETSIRALRAAVNRVGGDMPALIDDAVGQLTALAHVPLARLPATLQYRAIALNNAGVGILWAGRPETAERYLSMAVFAAYTVGVDLVEINAVSHLALLEVMYGSLREADRLVRVALTKAQLGGWTDSLQVVAAHHAAALIELDRGRPARAERMLQQGSRAHRGEHEAAQWKMSLGIAARVALAQDRVLRARTFLREAQQQRYPGARMPVIDRWLLAAESEADLRSGRPDLVQRRYAVQAGRGTLTLPERNLLVRAALAGNDLGGAEALLAERGSLMSETVATVEARILGALVSHTDGHGLRAAEMLAEAIALAAPEGIRRPFVTLAGRRLGPLIARQSLTTAEHTPFVADLLRLVGASAPTSGIPSGVMTLSDRETQVLRYLPTMLTAAEIGEELGVSVNTIKAHMRAIYRKLGTPRRREAVTRAREHGLI